MRTNRAGVDTARYFTQGETQSGTPYYYAKDQVGSVIALIDADGNIAGRTTYDAYGNITTQTGVQPGYAYAGFYYHQASGLYLATYRAYDSGAARWLNRDPIEESGGISLYTYVENDPVDQIDPLGLSGYLAIGVGGSYFGDVAGGDMKLQAAVGFDSQWHFHICSIGETCANAGLGLETGVGIVPAISTGALCPERNKVEGGAFAQAGDFVQGAGSITTDGDGFKMDGELGLGAGAAAGATICLRTIKCLF